MSGIRFTDEFKRDAVAQVVERGYSVADSFGTIRDQHQVTLHVEHPVFFCSRANR